MFAFIKNKETKSKNFDLLDKQQANCRKWCKIKNIKNKKIEKNQEKWREL